MRDRRPRREASWLETRVERVVVVESLMSRKRCSTPISSASSASIAEGTCRNVFLVSEPSYIIIVKTENQSSGESTYVFDLLDGKVGISRDSNGLLPNVHNDHDRSCNVPFEQIVNLLV